MLIKYIFIIINRIKETTEVNETQKWATSKKSLRTLEIDHYYRSNPSKSI